MRKHLKNISYIGFAALHLAVAVFVGSIHFHIAVEDYNAPPRITAHNCGANEVHKKLDKTDHCVICHRITGSVAFIGFSFSSTELSFSNIQSPVEFSKHDGDIYVSASKRGPPVLNS
ncbi:MAG: hypothetical protein HY276_08325 [Ignavibacteriales bacterium]|nr:hypothetical protein [Ignavibacteriales bacterium]